MVLREKSSEEADHGTEYAYWQGPFFLSGALGRPGIIFGRVAPRRRRLGGVAQSWVERYNGPGNSYDAAKALGVDGQGNVHVTGSSVSVDTGYDYATVKYTQSGAYVPLGLLLID
jgi:hypothetical protein